MIFNKTHHNYILKYFEPTAMLSWDDHQIEMLDLCNISEFIMFQIIPIQKLKISYSQTLDKNLKAHLDYVKIWEFSKLYIYILKSKS